MNHEDECTQFRENLLCLQILCNSLDAVWRDLQGEQDSGEIKALVRYLRKEWPRMWSQNAALLESIIGARNRTDYRRIAVLEIARDDRKRLDRMMAGLINMLSAVASGRHFVSEEDLRHALSSYLAAQRGHLNWLRKAVSECCATPEPRSPRAESIDPRI